MTEEIRVHLAQDVELARLIETVDLHEIEKGDDIFGSLVSSIISQQLSVKAAATIYKRFEQLIGGLPTPEKLLALTEDELRSVGISRQKTGYLYNIADFFSLEENRQLPWRELEDTEVLKKLVSIKGVGEWTVHMIMIFRLGREDVLPVGDLGIQNGMVKLYGLEGKGKELHKKMKEIAAPWAPYRSYASRLIWKSLDNE
ncbi:DNA-3-methyladenine glycosylase 2 family protein [Limibacter armeniacum]|uniref:DNA-3-methyladenine glycosylase family protein n=1 Tax=Limibacter armeniacum TaxID=466084 RepID=UPI002FE67C59